MSAVRRPPASISTPDEPAPIWLTTLSDMTFLLLVFFILLFSLGIQDRKKYSRIAESLEAMVGPSETGLKGATGAAPAGDADAAIFRAFESQKTAATQIVRPRGHHALLQKLADGTLLTLGGAQDAFPEGAWELSDPQKEALAGLKEWLRGRRNVVEIRGHTASNLADSVVLEPGGRFRPFSKEDAGRDDRHAAANHSMLSWLRAEEVRRFLAAEHPEFRDAVKIPETRMRIRAEGYGRTLDEGDGEAERARNRRIEVLLTTDGVER
jgi:flagellar motor protein MotB